MKLSSYQRKQLADKVTDVYVNQIGVKIGYFITPREREKLTVFAMRLFNLRGEKYSVDYVRSLYFRQMRNCNVIVCLCASLICRDILDCDFEFVPLLD